MVRATVVKVGELAGELAGEGVLTNKAKGDKMALESPMNSAHRRKLGDITNLQNHKANQYQQYTEKLQKENMKLTKILMERNKIIEVSGSELQKLRISFQKVQEQNMQLAQTNTRILAEMNTSKDQLKVLRHELSCKNGLLMARKLLLEGKNLPRTHCHTSEDKDRVDSPGGACESFLSNCKDHKTGKRKQQSSIQPSESSNVNTLQINEEANNKRRVSGRTNPVISEVLDLISRPGESIEKTNMRRVSKRRQSARFNIHELGVIGNLNGIHDDQEITANTGRVSGRTKPADSEVIDIIGRPGESIEKTNMRRVSKRIQSARFNIHELGVTENLNGIHDDQEITANGGCSVSDQSIGSKPEGVKPHDTEVITGKSRVCTRRQTTKVKPQETIKEPPADPPLHDDIVKESSSVPMELKIESKKKPRDSEAEEVRETSVGGRPLRQAAGKIKSYKEPSLKDKMRRSL